jgi:hypothetical protein
LKKIVDEEELYLKILEEGFSRWGHPTYRELLVVAKRIRQIKGFGEKNIVGELIAFCEDRNPNFNFDLEEAVFGKVARQSIKNSEWDKVSLPIHISGDEIEKIRTVKNFSYQKILFSTLVSAKGVGNQMFFSDENEDIRHFIDISGERCSIAEFHKRISHEAYLKNIFEHIKTRSSFFRLIGNPKGDAVITIDTMEKYYNAGDVYYDFIGGVLNWCSSCGEEFPKTSNNHKRCKTCALKKRKGNIRKRVDKFNKK